MIKKRFQKIAVYLTAVLSFVICGFLYSCTNRRETGYIIEQPESIGVTCGTDSGVSENVPQDETQSVLCVYVCGNVVNPGVYEAGQNARVYELIDMAGGVSDEGCLEALNLAEYVYDGQKLYIPDYDEYAQAGMNAYTGKDEKQTGLVNINSASADELMTLPGIGRSRAEAIVEYRTANGGFAAVEDIMKVSGIKENSYSKIKDLICVR